METATCSLRLGLASLRKEHVVIEWKECLPSSCDL